MLHTDLGIHTITRLLRDEYEKSLENGYMIQKGTKQKASFEISVSISNPLSTLFIEMIRLLYTNAGIFNV